MIEKTFWNDEVNAFVDAMNEQDTDIKYAVQELLNALNSAASLRLEARSVAVRAYREGLISERDFNALLASANN